MQNNNSDTNSVHIHYSPTAKYSIGYKGEYWRHDHWLFQGVQLNYLVKRWNGRFFQANFYFKNALGWFYANNSSFDYSSGPAGFTSVALDWETRRWFVGYTNRLVGLRFDQYYFNQAAKVGVAPYIGQYGDLHTWAMIEVEQNDLDQQHSLQWTPMLRFFKGDLLLEVGYTLHKGAVLNWIYRF